MNTNIKTNLARAFIFIIALTASAAASAWHGGWHGGGDWRGGGWHNNAGWNERGWNNRGWNGTVWRGNAWGGPAVVIGVPVGRYYAPRCYTRCNGWGQCWRRCN